MGYSSENKESYIQSTKNSDHNSNNWPRLLGLRLRAGGVEGCGGVGEGRGGVGGVWEAGGGVDGRGGQKKKKSINYFRRKERSGPRPSANPQTRSPDC